VLIVVAVAVSASGVISIVTRGPLKAEEARATAKGPSTPAGLDPVAVATATELDAGERRSADARMRAEAGDDAGEADDAAR
jgi:Flp pilus assembly protein CpaB